MIKPVSFTSVPQIKFQPSTKMPKSLKSDFETDQVSFGSLNNVVKTVIDKGNKLDNKMSKKFFGGNYYAAITIASVGGFLAAPLILGPLGGLIAQGVIGIGYLGKYLPDVFKTAKH
ncbi:MAG: hypothetical protein A2104_00555 [Candidatus Melainabacteria bacterium GWF2_32_7]|nr:MAG: hypothetical protein A2104_00555 [Candidatus Melainabacteria bacterium GWF2_32_7]